jgi:hypothetical protein
MPTLRVFAVSAAESFSVTASEEFAAAMRRLSGTTLLPTGAANVWAGTTGLELVGALNTKAGNARGSWLPLQAVVNQLAGTSNLPVAAAARQIPL